MKLFQGMSMAAAALSATVLLQLVGFARTGITGVSATGVGNGNLNDAVHEMFIRRDGDHAGPLLQIPRTKSNKKTPATGSSQPLPRWLTHPRSYHSIQARQETCVDGRSYCWPDPTEYCSRCGTCCLDTNDCAGDSGVCCTGRDTYCSAGRACCAGGGCCPEEFTECCDFGGTCCIQGATCSSNGCEGTPDFSLSIVTVTFTSTELAVSYITSTSTRMTLSTSITINTQISTTTVTGGTTTIFSTSTTYVPPDGDVNKRTHIALEQLGEVVTAEPATSSSLSSPGNEVEVEEDVYLLAQAPLERRALKARQDVTSTFTESSWDWFTTFATSTTSTTVTSTNTVTSTSNSLSWSTYNVNPDFTEIGLVVVTETGTDPELTDDDGGGLSEGAKAGIGVGAAIGGVALLGAIAAIFFMKKRRRDQAGESDANHKPQAAISGGPGWKPSIQPSPVGNDVPPLMSQQQPAGSTWPGIGAAASAAAVGTTTGMYPTGTPNNNNHNKNSPGDRPSSIQPSNFHTEGSYSSGSPVLLHSPGSTQSPGAATHHYSQAMPTAPYGPVYASVTPPTDNGNRTWSSAAASSNAPPPPPPQHQGMVTESSHVNITQPVINVSSSSSSPPLRNSGTVHEMGSDHMTWAAGPAHATYEMPAAGPEAQQQAWENRGTGEYVPGQGVAEWGQQHHQHQHQHHHEWEHGPQSFAGPQEQR